MDFMDTMNFINSMDFMVSMVSIVLVQDQSFKKTPANAIVLVCYLMEIT